MSSQTRPIRVFIVEDHSVMRGMLCEAVKRLPDCTLTGVAATAESALSELADEKVDLVLVDVSLPRMSGIELVRTLTEQRPELACLMVSGHTEAGYAEQALRAGARGYVLKGRPDDLAAGIAAAVGGRRFLSEPLASRT